MEPRYSEVVRKADQSEFIRPDLSDAVTVFVTTVGAPSYPACLEHLGRQDCRFRFAVIDHVAPMNAAFQKMLDECRTPYYVQVDEDMLLYPHAVRTLHQRIESAAPSVAGYFADLYDVHLERCILGIKIFRHEIVRRYPFRELDAFETDQIARLEADGFLTLRTNPGPVPVEGDTLGLHGTQWTPQSIYERYAGLERRRQTRQALHWFRAYPAEFLARFLEDPNEEDFFALMGVIAGALASRHGAATAKDYRTYETLPGFRVLRQFLAEIESQNAGANGAQRRRLSRRQPRSDRLELVDHAFPVRGGRRIR